MTGLKIYYNAELGRLDYLEAYYNSEIESDPETDEDPSLEFALCKTFLFLREEQTGVKIEKEIILETERTPDADFDDKFGYVVGNEELGYMPLWIQSSILENYFSNKEPKTWSNK